jgi:hypothetical protein
METKGPPHRDWLVRSAYLETPEIAAILLPLHLHMVDPSVRRTVIGPFHKLFKILPVALRDDLDRTVGQITRQTAQSEHPGSIGGSTPEKHSLHPPGYNYANAR